jgi:hypothetical protein
MEQVVKRRSIKQQLEAIDKRLTDAEKYVAQNVNVKGASFLHLSDWDGQSGHPLWMKNVMIPTTKKVRAKKEKTLEDIIKKNKGKNLKRRNRQRDDQ